MVAQGIPHTISMMQEVSRHSEELTRLNEKLDQISNEQCKLSELIPLSAAASGMIVGEVQMRKFETQVQRTIIEAIRHANETISTSEETKMELRENGFQLFLWGGKYRYVPPDFEISTLSDVPICVLWNKWFLGSVQNEIRIRPLKILFSRHRQDINDVCRHQDMTANQVKQVGRAITETCKVMKFFESLHSEAASLHHLDPFEGTTVFFGE
jgi:hypothetical protein